MLYTFNKTKTWLPGISGKWRYLFIFFGALLLITGRAYASEKIIVLTSDDSPLYAEFIASFKQYASTSATPDRDISVIAVNKDIQPESIENASLVLAVGVRATEAAIRLNRQSKILSALVPRITIEALKQRSATEAALSVIYLDQPPARQLRLIRTVLPDAERIGIPLGSFSNHLVNEFSSAARNYQLDLLLTQATTDPLAAVVNALPRSDAILALPDAGVYNHSTIRAILLGTFRAKVPIFGYSAAFVEAGALAGVYSSPAQIGRQAAELSGKLLAGGAVPETSYPKYFTVKTNRQIAQVLNIALPGDEILHAKIMSGEQ